MAWTASERTAAYTVCAIIGVPLWAAIFVLVAAFAPHDRIVMILLLWLLTALSFWPGNLAWSLFVRGMGVGFGIFAGIATAAWIYETGGRTWLGLAALATGAMFGGLSAQRWRKLDVEARYEAWQARIEARLAALRESG